MPNYIIHVCPISIIVQTQYFCFEILFCCENMSSLYLKKDVFSYSKEINPLEQNIWAIPGILLRHLTTIFLELKQN